MKIDWYTIIVMRREKRKQDYFQYYFWRGTCIWVFMQGGSSQYPSYRPFSLPVFVSPWIQFFCQFRYRCFCERWRVLLPILSITGLQTPFLSGSFHGMFTCLANCDKSLKMLHSQIKHGTFFLHPLWLVH